MVNKRPKIAIIDNSLDSSLYNPIRHWSSYLPKGWKGFKAQNGSFPDLKKGFSHIIITGSEISILDDYPWLKEEVKIIQEAANSNIAILGSCYGHQLLALALAGPNCVKRSDQPEVGWFPIQIKKDNRLLGKKGIIYSFACHFDEVVNLGPDFEILASSTYCQIQAFKIKNKRIWGLQPHPEINIKEAKAFLERLVLLDLPTSAYFKKALQQQPKDSGIITRIVNCFISNKNFFP